MKTIIAAVALLFAAPAAAQQPAQPSSAVVAPVASGGSAAKSGEATRYCVRAEMTGSRIVRKVCRTREAWLAEGFDPLADKGG